MREKNFPGVQAKDFPKNDTVQRKPGFNKHAKGGVKKSPRQGETKKRKSAERENG